MILSQIIAKNQPIDADSDYEEVENGKP